MDWKEAIRERLQAAVAGLDYITDEQKANLVEVELERVVISTEAGQPIGAEPKKLHAEEDEEPETEVAKSKKVKALKDTFAPGGWPPVKTSGTK